MVTAREAETTKERLLRAGERLFAVHGIHRVRLREINALAGQRNASALHYHFGSRDGLVVAILSAHQTAMDEHLRPALHELESSPSIQAIVAANVEALARELETESGRDFLRILPQLIDLMSSPLRGGAQPEARSAQTARTLSLLEQCMSDVPVAVRRERLVAYALFLTSLFAERATLIEAGDRLLLNSAEFVAHVTDVVCGALEAPSTVDPDAAMLSESVPR